MLTNVDQNVTKMRTSKIKDIIHTGEHLRSNHIRKLMDHHKVLNIRKFLFKINICKKNH